MEWISIKDRIPEEYQSVLTYCASCNEKVKIDYQLKIKDDYIWACRSLNDEIQKNVSHWMPIPELPISEEQ